VTAALKPQKQKYWVGQKLDHCFKFATPVNDNIMWWNLYKNQSAKLFSTNLWPILHSSV